ncbi:MAG: hypothetical protein HC886_21150 [Leptolyngbyaceae cyanobacterium SM1_1_3]|nr:hypothetical protein [Leptolyngbyaceae cyanobacterium SM1_1_3]NJN01255.1 hypothetical protein [Leptolyngbyaceae cyanobacterium RM1_1_2]NJO11528.1 hypothetical protein [Leptolyngbyaceae cyanobacterium SL_1_1]
MLCNTCQRQQTCLPSLLAQQDQQMQKLLRRLQKCDRRILKTAPVAPLTRLKACLLQS